MSKVLVKRASSFVSTAIIMAMLATTTAFAAAPDSLPNLDSDKLGSVTIHKYQTEDESYVGSEGTGLLTDADTIDTTKATPFANIEFTIFKIGDTDIVGEEAPVYDSSLLVEDDVTGKWSYNGSEEVGSILTNAEGIAAFTSLTLGRYLVVETDTPSSVVTKAEPFFVDVPMTNRSDNSSWVYDIHAFPKNVVKYDTPDTPEKSITEIGNRHETATVGDTLSWIIESDIPTTVNDYEKYIISDVLDTKIGYVADSIEVKMGTSYDTATVVDSANYDLVVPETIKGGNISVSFKESYLSTLTESTDTTTYYFYVKYNTKIYEASFSEDGIVQEIENGVEVTYDYNNKPTEDTGLKTIDPNDKPEVHSGGLRFTKVSDRGEALSGAEFKIATSKENALAGIFIKDAYGNDMISVSKEGTGYVEFTGLAYGETGDDAKTGSTTYWVVETKAPSGYQLLTEPKSFVVSYNSYSETYAVASKLVNNADIDLPLTGSTSGVIFIFAGVALISFACILMVKPKFKKK